MIEAIAVVLLVLIAVVRLDAGAGGRWIPAVFVAGLVCALVAHHHFARPLGAVVDAESSRLVAHARPRLREALADPDLQLLVVVNGASVTARGVNGHALEARLRQQTGLRASVVQLSLAGANHIERQAIARSLLEGLSGDSRKRLAGIPLVVLWEVHRGYDVELLAQFEENRDTARAYAYLDAHGSLAWLRAASSINRPALRRQALELAPDVARHAGISSFRIGSSRWFTRADEIEPLAGFNPEERLREHARVVGLAANVERMKAVKPAGAPRYVDSHLVPDYLHPFENPHAEVVFFAPPSRHVGHMAYVHRFCVEHPDRVCIGFRNRALLESLDHRRYWVDGSHLTPSGAAGYTRWLADVLSRAVIRHDLARNRGDYG